MTAEREATLEFFGLHRLSAIIRTPDGVKARRAMEAAMAGGFRILEFTLNTGDALALIREFSRKEGVVVGAGTVLTPEEAREAVEAGARFLVSPVADPEVIRASRALGAVSIPGTYTPTEMMAAHRAGADLVKVFPAHADMVAIVNQIRGPLPFLKLFPTAGVSTANFEAVLEAGAYGVGFVAGLFDPADMAAGRFEAIERRASEIMDRFRSRSPALG